MIGRKLSNYRIMDELNRGGMGVVYRAVDDRLHREIALKVLPPELVSDPDRRQRFEQEARAAAALEHPNIGVVYEIDEEQDVVFIAMERIHGKSLQEWLLEGPLEKTKALDFAIEIAEGLGSAHDKDIVHRDLKPSNLMVTEAGHIKIIDFGLAKLLSGPFSNDSESETRLRRATLPGEVVGTAHYMSPEQARGKKLDGRSDLFSFGVVLYEMLTGQPPFNGDSTADVVSAILKEPAPRLPPRSVPAPVSTELQRILDKCLSKDPDERYQNARDLVVDLRRLRRMLEASEAGFALAPPPRSRISGRGLAVAAFVVGLVIASVLGWRFFRGSRATVSSPAPESSVAVLGFKNLTEDPDVAWLSTAISEMLGTELSSGASLRVVPGDEVARMKIELSLEEADHVGGDQLAQIRNNLHVDYIVLGSYTFLGRGESGQIRLDARLQDTSGRGTVFAHAESGSETELFQIVERAGTALRDQLGLDALSEDEARRARAAHSADPEASRFYSEGLSELRRYQALEARVLLEKATLEDPSFALAQAALSQAWSALGYDKNAEQAARRAFELAEGLPREDSFIIEGRFHETMGEWDEAVRTYGLLRSYHPDNVDHGLRLVEALTGAGRAGEALDVLEQVRVSHPQVRDDPRFDLAEAQAAALLSEFERAIGATERVVSRARSQEAWLLVAEGLYQQGSARVQAGEPERARAALEEARRLFAQGGNRGKVAECTNQLAILLKYEGDLEEAERLYREALEIHRETGDRGSASYVLNNLAFMIWQKGELSVAESLLTESLGLAREVGNARREAGTLDTLSSVYLSQGRLASAKETTSDALRIAQTMGERSMSAWMVYTLGLIAHASGDLVEARAKYDEALAICEEIGYQHLTAYVLNDQGRLLLDGGELPAAEAKLEASRKLRLDLGEKGTLAETDLNRAVLFYERGELEGASATALGAAGEFEREGMPDHQILARALAARIALARGAPADAREQIGRVAARAESSQNPEVQLTLGMVEARSRALAGDPKAPSALATALERANELGLVRLALEARLALAEAHDTLGNREAARREAEVLALDADARGFHLLASKARKL